MKNARTGLSKSTKSLVLGAALTACLAGTASAANEFIRLGSPFNGPGSNQDGCFLSGFRNGLYGIRVSDDGKVVAGISYLNVQSIGGAPIIAFRWTREEGATTITPLLDIIYDGVVGLSADGDQIFGSNWRWTKQGGYESLEDLLPPGPIEFGYIFGASSDGQTLAGVAGSYFDFTTLDAFRLPLSSGVRQTLPRVDEYPSGAFLFNTISGDGSVVAGSVADRRVDADNIGLPQVYAGVVWAPGETIIVAPFSSESFVNDLSFDGSVAVGSMKMGSFNAFPFRWTRQGGAQILPGTADLLRNGDSAEGRAVSADGSVIVGTRTVFGEADSKALYYDEVRGLRDFDELLATELGLGEEIEGWKLVSLWDVSADGRTVVGTGINPEGCTEAFLVTIDPRCPSDVNIDGEVDFLDFLAFFNCFDEGLACGNIDRQGDIDFLDFLAFFNGFDTGC
jgi:uncharacterized membrane protein